MQYDVLGRKWECFIDYYKGWPTSTLINLNLTPRKFWFFKGGEQKEEKRETDFHAWLNEKLQGLPSNLTHFGKYLC